MIRKYLIHSLHTEHMPFKIFHYSSLAATDKRHSLLLYDFHILQSYLRDSEGCRYEQGGLPCYLLIAGSLSKIVLNVRIQAIGNIKYTGFRRFVSTDVNLH